MDITLAASGVTYQPNDDQLSGVSIGLAAFDGEAGTGTLPVPDPAAALTVVTGRRAKVVEAGTVLSDGFVLDQDRDRGPLLAGTARQYNFGIVDANALLDGFRVQRSRPSETDVARVLAFAAADFPSWDTTWVVNTETVTVPAKVFNADGGWTSELIPDVVGFTGKTLWVHDKAAGGRCLHYHNLTSGHGCGLSISDVYGAQSSTVYYPDAAVTRQRTSADLRNDVVGQDQAGRTSTATDSTSITAHDADGLQHQALIFFEANNQTDLDVQTAAYLASQKDDLDTYLVTIGPLDANALAKIRVGDIITVTSSVLGLTASPQRISHMELVPWGSSPANSPDGLYWAAHLELGAPVRRRRRVASVAVVGTPGTGIVVPPVFVPCTDSDPDYTNYLPLLWSYDLPGEEWDEVVGDPSPHMLDQRDGVGTDHSVKLFYTIWIDEGATGVTLTMDMILGVTMPNYILPYCTTWEVHMSNWGNGPPTTFSDPQTLPASIVIASGDGPSTLEPDVQPVVVATFGLSGPLQLFITGTPYTGNPIWVGVGPDPGTISTDPGWTYTETYAAVDSVSAIEWSYEPCSPSEPYVGQPVRVTDIVGDGVTTSFTTEWHYQPGTLRLWVAGIDWTPMVNATSPTTGAYTLDYPIPDGASTVVLEYRRAA